MESKASAAKRAAARKASKTGLMASPKPSPATPAPTDTNATLADRGSRYGTFNRTASIIQNIKGAMRNSPNWATLSATQTESLEMVAHKIGRILSGDANYADSWHDVAGYASLVDKILNGENP